MICLAIQRSFLIFTSLNLKIINMNLVERFLRYVSFDTQSDENSGVTPSSAKQMVFAQYLKGELEALGLEEIELDEKKHVGLRNIRGRLKAMVDGELILESKPGVGTQATIMIPKEVTA